MFEFKYFARISALEQAEQAVTNPQPLPPFDVDQLGTDNFIRRSSRRLTRWFFLFAFAVLRAVWPVARIGRLVVVSRYDDVCKVLADRNSFQVPFGPEMKTVTDGVTFALGLDGQAHDDQRAIMEAVVLPSDAAAILDHTRVLTRALIDGSGGRIDIMRDLFGRVFTETCSRYFALDLDDPNGFLNRSMAISSLLFADLFGDEKARKLALNGAVRVRYLIDQAIDAAQERRRAGTARPAVIDRLVAHRQGGQPVSRAEIRAIVTGIMTGMVPTSTLGAGKIMEELQRRRLLKAAVREAQAAETNRQSDPALSRQHRRNLHDMLFEALRLNPALSPGLFRHAPKATSVAGRPIAAGSIVLAAAMSALRDPSQFTAPGSFRPGRSWARLPGVQPAPPTGTEPLHPATLMFGSASHGCLAAHLAMEQITEILQILLSQPGIKFSKRPVGRLAYLGLFPRRLDMEFEPAASPRDQNLVTIQAPLAPGTLEEVRKLIEGMGNPAHANLRSALDRTRVVHFASMSAINAADPDDPSARPDPRLLLELNVDGDVDAALIKVAGAGGQALADIFSHVAGAGQATVLELLRRHTVKVHFMPWGAIGLNFNGTPDCPVDDIRQQRLVAAFARKAIDQYLQVHNGVHKRAMDALTYVRNLTRGDEVPLPAGLSPGALNTERKLRRLGARLRPLLVRPARRRLAISDWTGRENTVGWPALLRSRVGLFIGLLIATTTCLQASAIYYMYHPDSCTALVLAILGFAGGAILLLVTLAKDGFDSLLAWYGRILETTAYVVTLLLAAVADLLFLAFLIVRCISWPVALLALGAAAWWGVERIQPGLPLPVRGAAAVLAGGLATFLLYAFLPRFLEALARAARQLVVPVLVGAAAFGLLCEWAPTLGLHWRWGAALAVAAATLVVTRNWSRVVRLLRAFQRWSGLDSARIVVAVVAVTILANLTLVVRFIEGHGPVIIALGGGFVGTILVWAIPIGLFALVLAWHERNDPVDDRTASLAHIREIAQRENPPGHAHNHITAVTPLKPGAFRKVTLALAMWGIGKLVQYWFRPGFVLNMGTIHYARWFRLPESEVFVFFSNYDGSWLSYLEDFITKAHQGQSAAWSNGRGFPRTRLLVGGGAEDGDRFKRWVRRQQVPTQFWYSRFPELTTDQIRGNALIHQGLMHARTDTAARAWLDCFGTIPRPESALESEEVQSLVFRGLPGHLYTVNAALSLPANPTALKGWLAHLRDTVEFGEQSAIANKPATFVAFSARGLEICLGVDPSNTADSTMAAFPAAFRLGMGERSRSLGDADGSVKQWQWADVDTANGKAIHAMLFIYGQRAADCQKVLAAHRALLPAGSISHVVATEPTAMTLAAINQNAANAGQQPGRQPAQQPKPPLFEHFGFRDGISQPVIRGSQKEAVAPPEADIVEAGEFILGYRDSSGHMAPAITLPADRDGQNDLETDSPDFASRFPRFGESRTADLRDFGRNGTFVAIRQLEQHVNRFNAFLTAQTAALSRYPGIEQSVGGPVSEEWLAAKMMGRWRSGASLIRWPNEVVTRAPPDEADNDFRFGEDDPQGLRCPLGAHIRRANPRGSLAPDDPMQLPIEKRHRLLRRGRPYEGKKSESREAAPGEGEKGLMFIGLCADLERQFEFLQQTWIGSPGFHGLSREPDPVTGGPLCPRDRVFTIPTPGGPVTLKGLEDFVTVRGGGYFFMPSRSALRFLARIA